MYNVSDKFKEYVKNNGYIEKRAKSAKEPVAKLKWPDFELEPLKPNLIKNGWDDFEAYGSGKNYVENWDFENDDLSQTYSYRAKRSIANGVFRVDFEGGGTNYFEFQHMGESSEKLLVRFKARGNGGVRARAWTSVEKSPYEYFHTTDEWAIYEFEVNYIGGGTLRTRIYNEDDRYDRYMEIDWIQITPIDNQHLVVEKTPLGNRLTRVQTWGGTSDVKLKTPEISNNIEVNSNTVYSLYIENNGKEELRFLNNWAIAGEPCPGGAEYMITVPPNYKGMAYLKGVKKDSVLELNVRSSNNPDFIASDPQIIEGDKPNPILIVDDLDNGKSKVQVFGANENTKLVHRGTKGIKGEPYTVKTNIDNKGNQLQLDTNLDEQSETIKKGNNDVKLEGKLKDNNIEIKLGRG